MPSHRRAGEQDPDQPEARHDHKHSGRLLKVALLGGAIAMLVNDDIRNQLLDMLFGAEEEFDYSSITEPVAPGGEHRSASAVGDDPSSPWVGSAGDSEQPAQQPDASSVVASNEEPERAAADAREAEPGGPSVLAGSDVADVPVWRISSGGEPPSSTLDEGAPPTGPTMPAIAPSPAAWRRAAESSADADEDRSSEATDAKPARDWWLRDEPEVSPPEAS